MTSTATETSAQVTSTEPRNAVEREAEEILDRAQLAIDAIEGGVDDLNSSMVELLILATDLPDEAGAEVQTSGNDLGVEANEMFKTLDHHLEQLRQFVITAAADEDEEEDEDEDEDEAAS